MEPSFPIEKTPKKHILYESGIGSLNSWYEQGVESQGFKSIRYDTNQHARGSLPLFPQLDVMAGDASAENDAIVHNWGLTDYPIKNIDVAVLNYEEMLGGLNGFRIHNNTGFEEDNFNQYKQSTHDNLFMFDGQNIDQHSAQGPHGRHVIDGQVAELSAQVAIQHNVGDSLEARDSGLERGENPAVNAQETGKGEVYENQDTIDTSAPTTIPMEIDAIEINNTVTLPMDTDVALGANQTS